MRAPTISDTPGLGVDNLDPFWDPSFLTQDILPAALFDTNLLFIDTPPSIQRPQTGSFSWFSSRLPPLDGAGDDAEDTVEDNSHGEGITAARDVLWSTTGSSYGNFVLESKIIQTHFQVGARYRPGTS